MKNLLGKFNSVPYAYKSISLLLDIAGDIWTNG